MNVHRRSPQGLFKCSVGFRHQGDVTLLNYAYTLCLCPVLLSVGVRGWSCEELALVFEPLSSLQRSDFVF
jgi:hypothetical protein